MGAFMLAAVWTAGAQAPTPEERVNSLKGSLAVSQELLRQYEWIETTVVSVKGEEKSRQMNRCYYGADGKVQKVPLTMPPPAEKKKGIRGMIAEQKKEEMTEYMQNGRGAGEVLHPARTGPHCRLAECRENVHHTGRASCAA